MFGYSPSSLLAFLKRVFDRLQGPLASPRWLSNKLAKFRPIRPLVEAVFPTPRYLKDETVNLVIRMAAYRQRAAQYLSVISFVVFVVAGLIALVGWNIRRDLTASVGYLQIVALSLMDMRWLVQWTLVIPFIATLLTILGLGGFVIGWKHLLLYEQWQFIVTNKRLVLITPDPERQGFADAIYLKRGKIQVIDTNWSANALWGLFQASTGARDVVLSMSGYEFLPQGARVRGGLLFPDVEPKDIEKLEELIFG